MFSSQFKKEVQKEIHMEALLIRGFVLALALSGFGASTVSSNSSASVSANDSLTGPPVCPYNDPNFCGID
jgi:hypothetical protein